MNSEIAVVSAIGVAICNAAAAIMQKVSSDKVAKIKSYNLDSVINLFQQLPYVAGVVIDLFAGVLTLIAVNKLPLFLVQAVFASSVVLTAFCEQIFLKRKMKKRTYGASLIVMVGLGLLALSSHSEHTAQASSAVKYIFGFLPIVLAAAGFIAIKLSNKAGAFILSSLSGVAFGGVSVIGRLLVYPSPVWLIYKNPLLWAMAAFGALGLYHFTAALQRTLATTANGVMLSAQTVIPLLVGIFLLGDTARNGLWGLVWAGCALVTVGCVYIAFHD